MKKANFVDKLGFSTNEGTSVCTKSNAHQDRRSEKKAVTGTAEEKA